MQPEKQPEQVKKRSWRGGSKPGRTQRQVDQNRANMVQAIAEGKPPAEVAAIGGLSTKNPSQSVYQSLRGMRTTAREIVADLEHPVEVIFKEHLLPKLKAQRRIYDRGVEMSREPNEELQAKVAIEILKMAGMYAPMKVQFDVNHRHHLDLSGATDDDLRAIVRIANRSRSGNSRGNGRILQAPSVDVAPGG